MQQEVGRERDDLSSNSSFEKLPAGFQVDFEVRLSNISPEIGLGIFTKQFIPNGSLIWKYSRGSNVISYANEQEVKTKLEKLNQHECEFFMSHVYLFDGFMNEILDSGKYWNHVRNLKVFKWNKQCSATFHGKSFVDDVHSSLC